MKKLVTLMMLCLFYTLSEAQIKVYTGGIISVGSTTAPATGFRQQIVGKTLFTSSAGTPTTAPFIRGSYSSNSTATLPDYSWYGDTTTGIFHPASSVIAFTIANSEKVRIDANGRVGIGTTSANKPLDIASSGGIRISRTDSMSTNNELFFQDYGQISSHDDKHRIIFDRGHDILELREYGDIYFSPGSTTGWRTQKVTFTAAGNINLNGATKSYQINGVNMLWNNNTASDIFVGNAAGNASMSGHRNTLVGNSAGVAITSGARNSFIGYRAGYVNTTGTYNTALGDQALLGNITGEGNTAMGEAALAGVTSGNNNIGIGYSAGTGITSGGSNILIGYGAGLATNTGSNNILVGTNTNVNASTYSNAAAFGNGTVVTASNKIFFGNTSVTHIQGQVNFTTYSDGRFKTDITENVKGLEFINKLRPVTYKMDTRALDDFMIQNMVDSLKTRHQTGVDFEASSNIIRSGFIAQEVELASQEVGFTSSIVSAPANSNDPYALSYAEIVVPLVKAVQQLSKKADSLQTETSNLDSVNALKDLQLQAMQEQINQLASSINECCNSERAIQQTNSNSQSSSNSIDGGINGKNAIVLYQNKPNPFNNETTIEYYIPANTNRSSILIFDMQGKLIKTLELLQKENGNVKIDGKSLFPGMYMYSLVVDGKEIDTKRMILTK